jgi:hypothetical protein
LKIAHFRKIAFLLLLFILAAAVFSSPAFGDQTDAAAAISSAKSSLLTCYSAAQGTETAGGNITALVNTLNRANTLLSNAELAYARNDSAAAYDLAVQSQNQLSNFVSQANAVRNDANSQGNQSFLVVLVSVVGAFVVLSVGASAWVYLGRKQKSLKGDAHESRTV